MSASGHVPSGEAPKNSLIREIKEELGIDIKARQLKLLGKFWRNEFYRENFIENELDYIYVLEKDIDIKSIKIQEEEVEQVKYIDLETFKKMIETKKAVKREKVWTRLFEIYKNK